MDHTTFIVVMNNYGGIITQVARGYNTLEEANYAFFKETYQDTEGAGSTFCVLVGLPYSYRWRKIFTLLFGSFPRLRELKL
jgi:hypothetical protein